MTNSAKTIISRLAFSMERRDEQPNIDLAIELAASMDKTAIDRLVVLSKAGEKPLRYNAIKVLYELGERAPDLLIPRAQNFIDLLNDRDNRILWASIQVLDILTDTIPELIALNLDKILDAADRSSVIARDRAMSILSKLNADLRFTGMITPVILARLAHCAPNQFPMYADFAATSMPASHIPQLVQIIGERRKSIASPAKQKRLNKIVAELNLRQ